MRGLNYDKWNSLYISDDDNDTVQHHSQYKQSSTAVRNASYCLTGSLQGLSASKGSYTLYTIPWDSSSEMVRWALDRQGVNYNELEMPWGLHIWSILGISAFIPKISHLSVPILVNDKKEIFYTPSSIMLYLYSQSFFVTARLYSKVDTLEMQEEFDGAFASATRSIFLHEMLSNTNLANKYLRDQVHLNHWRAINTLVWPLLRNMMWLYYKLGEPATLDRAWEIVDANFSKVEKILSRQPQSVSNLKSCFNSPNGVGPSNVFLTGNTCTAADLSFASHASLVLFPNDDDGFGGKMGLQIPSVRNLSCQTQTRVNRLRKTSAGQFALSLYRKERGPRLAHKPSRHSSSNNPSWASVAYLQQMCLVYMVGLMIVIVLPALFLSIYISAIVWCGYAISAYVLIYLPNKEKSVIKRLRILYGILYDVCLNQKLNWYTIGSRPRPTTIVMEVDT
ncbi:hypothetical protein BASA61_005299 [Batrachochytrium salamandrivorans]|nr:hypothetical protein BASA62_001420 [Batrachochytrium salamandrivorans]KAH6590540.1 hypothetical protein BASA61_005299 [Batrachochytrium salamandrivorans]